MDNRLTNVDKHRSALENIVDSATRNVNESKRRILFSIAALLAGAITLVVAADTPLQFIFLIDVLAGLSWIILAIFYRFSLLNTTLKQIHFISFTVMVLQYLFTGLLDTVVTEHTLATFFQALNINILVLIITIVVSFIIFSAQTALKISVVITVVTLLVLFGTASTLTLDIRSLTYEKLIEPILYVVILVYLIRALALFQNDANYAIDQAEHYEKLAYFDSLTNIGNRRKLMLDLEKEIAKTQRYKTSLSILIFDIDHFKKVNDSYGHNMGDEVLTSVAAKASKLVRATDSLGRWGGEEFLCILPNTKVDLAYELAERLREEIAELEIKEGPKVTASFGIAPLLQTDTIDSFIHRADDALYKAKKSGRNCTVPVPTSSDGS